MDQKSLLHFGSDWDNILDILDTITLPIGQHSTVTIADATKFPTTPLVSLSFCNYD